MSFLRILGILISLAGVGMLFYSILMGGQAPASFPPSLAVIAMIGGLILVMGADAGTKLSRKQQDAAQKKAAKKPEQGG